MEKIKEWFGEKIVVFFLGGVTSGGTMLFAQQTELAKRGQWMESQTNATDRLVTIAESHEQRLKQMEIDTSTIRVRVDTIKEDVQELKHLTIQNGYKQ